MKRRINRSAANERRRRGQGLVEMALVFSALLLIVMGIVQYGIILNAVSTLDQVTREGARYASVNWAAGSTNNDALIKQHVRDMAAPTSISPTYLTDANIVVTNPGNQGGTRVAGHLLTVSVTYPLNKKIFIPFLPGVSHWNGSFSRSATVMME